MAASSPVLDAMLSSGMMESENKRIEFPEKDPAVWQLLLKCIDTKSALLYRYFAEVNGFFRVGDEESDSEEMPPILNESNVRSIVPLFHELQMDEYLEKCDYIIRSTAIEYTKWGDNEARSELLELLSFSTKYGLEVTRKYVQRQIEIVLERFCWGSGDQDDFDIHTVEKLVDICRPFKLGDEDDEVIYKGTIPSSSTNEPSTKKQRPNEIVANGIYQSCNCENLWAQVSSCIQEDLSVLPMEEVNGGKLFSRMIYFALQRYHTSMESELKQKTASLIGKKGCSIVIDNDGMREYSREVSDWNWKHENATMELIHAAIDEAAKKLVPFNAESGNFTRIYERNQKELRIVFEPTLSSDNGYSRPSWLSSKEFFIPQEALRNLRYNEPDLTVVVGRGKGAKEFQCHSVFLSFASTKLDSLVCNAKKKLYLPDFDPDSWQQFYTCIDPRHNGRTLNQENVSDLAPMFALFAEFEMHKYLEASLNAIQCSHCDVDEEPPVRTIATLLKCISGKGFTTVQPKVEQMVKELLDCDHDGMILLSHTFEFDVDSAKSLVSACLPIKRDSAEDSFTSESCPILWQGIQSYIAEKLKNVTFNRVGARECEVFSNFVHHLLLSEANERYRREHGEYY